MSHVDDLEAIIGEALPFLDRYDHEPLCQSFFDKPLPCNCQVELTKQARVALVELADLARKASQA